MLVPVDAVLHRLEALPGDGRYAVTFRRPDGSEQTAVAQLKGEDVEVAGASLPTDWSQDSDAWLAAADAVRAVEGWLRDDTQPSPGRAELAAAVRLTARTLAVEAPGARRDGAAEHLTREARHRRGRFRLQARVGPHLAPAPRTRLAGLMIEPFTYDGKVSLPR